MLVLSRTKDESIVIGDDIVVTVVDVRGDKVRLGVEAPREVSVHRDEVYRAIQRENQMAKALCSHQYPKRACPVEGCKNSKGVLDGRADENLDRVSDSVSDVPVVLLDDWSI